MIICHPISIIYSEQLLYWYNIISTELCHGWVMFSGFRGSHLKFSVIFQFLWLETSVHAQKRILNTSLFKSSPLAKHHPMQTQPCANHHPMQTTTPCKPPPATSKAPDLHLLLIQMTFMIYPYTRKFMNTSQSVIILP